MLLAINIGNTNTTMGLFKGMRLKQKFTLANKKRIFASAIKKITSKYQIESVVISSVVPQITKSIKQALGKALHSPPLIIGKDIFVPLKNLYLKPKTTGQDRLVNAYAAADLYGTPVVAVDFGTAITFDVVSREKEYLGGMIIAGAAKSLEALAKHTALLPIVKLKKPPELIGRSTKNSILSGIVYGLARLTDGLIADIKNKIGDQARVIACGGDARLIADYCRKIDRIDTDLTLKGIALVYQKNKIKKS